MSEPERPDPSESTRESNSAAYRVLARKYRPQTFSELIGQDAMVRTLTNAFSSGRLAHAFILTGVRGVGKTTTARIIARAFNCVGADGSGGPTTDPCGTCEHCVAIAEDRHVDVLEMDAASRTGVDDIRELIEGVRYRPTSARYKVYIIDEVHMLSKSAFNALLKTLEEPPEHVKFVFATTEIRKVPVTVLSRCQRYDLSRVDTETLIGHFADVAAREGADIDEAAIYLIARAADGSVRDGLSLLDQALSRATGTVGEDEVRAMLGLADRSQTFMLLEAVLAGDVAQGLKLFDQQYHDGADPAALFEDMLEITHWLTRVKIVPSAADAPQVPEIERKRGADMEKRLNMAALSRAWQMLLKGLQEVRTAPQSRQAAEMALVRLAYTAKLPTPEEAIRSLDEKSPSPPSEASGPPLQQGTDAQAEKPATPPQPASPTPPEAALTGTGDGPVPAPVAERPEPIEAAPEIPPPAPQPESFEDVLALADERREGVLRTHLLNDVRLVRFEPGRIEFNPGAGAPADLAGRLGGFLEEATGQRWAIAVSQADGEATIQEQRDAGARLLKEEALAHPLVKAVMETFPGAHVDKVRKTETPLADPDTETPDDPSNGDL